MPKINNHTFYIAALRAHGVSARGVHWADEQKQQLRFEIILDLLGDDVSTSTLVDAGCGFGDFYLYLQSRGTMPQRYIGVDVIEEFCDLARDRTEQQILCHDLSRAGVKSQDYVICSGALNILTPFETHLFIQNCYNSAKIGFVFNALYGDKKSATYNYLTKETIEMMAKKLDVGKIVYKEGYIKNDITVGFFR